MDFKAFLKGIEKYSSIAITAPTPPDGDSVGTQCALLELIETLHPQKKVFIVNEESCPQKYIFLKGSDKFIQAQDFKEKVELWICVDGGPNRLGDATTKHWETAKAHGLIDHHAVGTEDHFEISLYDPTAASTTVLVYKLWEESRTKLTHTLAEALYVGLIYDTGVFKHPNTTPEVMRIGAKLLETGFAHTDTVEKSLLMRTEANIHMLKSLLEHFKVEFSKRWVWSKVDHTAFKSSQGSSQDKDGLIDFLFLIPQCEIAILFFEAKPDLWKLSFRSRSWDVANLAKSLNPQGGGHKLASGCTLEGNFDTVYSTTQKAVQKLLHD
ncbi:MAG: bifunctional oligoribonuclease/PAP phosphatase NrnA [Proteobacteria bacterium]|nr:bifunctional oligoribonuclease/PAP phosphatase NrnA [Pseudomonadota bacterium]